MPSEDELSLPAPPRSPLLMNVDDTLLLVVDVQEKLWPQIASTDEILPRMKLLLEAARILGLKQLATEQYPKGLGATIEPIASLVETKIEKSAFSAGIEADVMRRIDPLGVRKIALVGIEAHVCVAQTALDLLASGFQVYVIADAIGSRRPADKAIALRRLEGAGVAVTTAEAVVFEWMQTAARPEFKQISQLIKAVPLSESGR